MILREVEIIKYDKRGFLAKTSTLLFILSICLITAQCQNANETCHRIEIGEYAKMSFCITANISVIPGTSEEGNYSQGEYVTTNILLSGKKVGINLIYPCKIRGGLTPSGLRSAVDAFDPEMAQANYNLTPMNISGLKALWGELENNTLVIYQPANKSVATLFFEEGISSRMKLEFLGALKIELSSYSPENYCAQSMAEIMPVQEAGDRSPFNRSTNKEFEPDREAMLIGREISQEALMADQRAIQCQA